MQDDPELWKLLHGWFAGSLNTEQLHLLEQRLRSDKNAAQLFVALSRVEDQLPRIAMQSAVAPPDDDSRFRSLTDRLDFAQERAGQVSNARRRVVRPPSRQRRRRSALLPRVVSLAALVLVALTLGIIALNLSPAVAPDTQDGVHLVGTNGTVVLLQVGDPPPTLTHSVRLTVDGQSIATVEAGSRLRMEGHDKQTLALYLITGAIEVNIVHGLRRPLIVRTEDLAVEILGTRYLLSHDEQGSTVDVLRGSVAVTTSDGQRMVLGANESHRVSRHAPQTTAQGSSAPEASAEKPNPWSWAINASERAEANIGGIDASAQALRSIIKDSNDKAQILSLTVKPPLRLSSDQLLQSVTATVELPAGGNISVFLSLHHAESPDFVANFQFSKQIERQSGWQTLSWTLDEATQRPPTALPPEIVIRSITVETIGGSGGPRPFALRSIVLQP